MSAFRKSKTRHAMSPNANTSVFNPCESVAKKVFRPGVGQDEKPQGGQTDTLFLIPCIPFILAKKMIGQDEVDEGDEKQKTKSCSATDGH